MKLDVLRLKALAAYSLLQARARAEYAEGTAPIKLQALARAAVLLASATGDSLAVTAKTSLLAAMARTGKFFSLLNIEDFAATLDTHKFDISKLLAEEIDAVDQAIVALRKVLNDTASTADTQHTSVGKNKLDSLAATEAQLRAMTKALGDAVESPDQALLDARKPLSDVAHNADRTASLVGKGVSDAAATLDVFARTAVFVRFFADSVDATDAIAATLVTDDGEVMLLEKRVLDQIATSESHDVFLAKALHDPVTLSELWGISSQKPRFDAFTAQDIYSSAVGKPREDQFAVSDVSALEAGKGVVDLVEHLDEQVIAFGKATLEPLVSFDEKGIAFQKPKADTFSAGDYASTGFEKSLADDVDATDDLNHTIGTDDQQTADFTKVRADSITLLDGAKRSTSKPFLDAWAVSDHTENEFRKREYDTAVTLDENVYAMARLIVDFAASTDHTAGHFEKTLHDFVSTSDSLLRSTTLAKLESLSSEDLADVIRIAANGVPPQTEPLHLSDVAAVLAFKNFRESLHATDDVLHETNVDDDQTVLFGKGITERQYVSEQRTVSLRRLKAESLGANDSGLLFWTNYCDSTYFSQGYVGNELTFT